MDDFKYIVDKFADIKVVRYRVDGFDKLNLNEKLYIYYLNEASMCGRDIIWAQRNKDNLMIRKTLENVIKTCTLDKNSSNYKKFIEYCKRFFFSIGFMHHYNDTKFYPEISRKYFYELLSHSEIDFDINDVIELIYSKNSDYGDILKCSVNDFYEGVSEKEAKDFYHKLYEESFNKNLSFGLNTKLINYKGKLKEKTYCLNGLYGSCIAKIVSNLEKACLYASSDDERESIELLIQFYKTGDLELWDQYCIKWLGLVSSKIDYINGFIEVYNDPIGIKGSYEGIVELIDENKSEITRIIAENALWFEENSPTDKKFKKKKITGVSANVVNVTMLAGDSYPSAPIGINLPNSMWIREKYGSKSVSIANLTEAVDYSILEEVNSSFDEFSYDKNDIELKKKYDIIASDIHTHLHECLGHASGSLSKGIRGVELHEYQSAIEETRAELFALYFLMDDKLIDLGIIDNKEIAKVFYESYIRGGLQVQLVRLKLGEDVVQAHMQARKLISTLAYEMGMSDNVIEKKIKDNKTYFVVNDYDKLREIFGALLKEVQRVVSEGDYNKARELIENYAVKVDLDLHKETLERYNKLGLKPYSGYVNPDYRLIIKNDDIIDVKVEYIDDFLKQQIDYGEYYSFLK